MNRAAQSKSKNQRSSFKFTHWEELFNVYRHIHIYSITPCSYSNRPQTSDLSTPLMTFLLLTFFFFNFSCFLTFWRPDLFLLLDLIHHTIRTIRDVVMYYHIGYPLFTSTSSHQSIITPNIIINSIGHRETGESINKKSIPILIQEKRSVKIDRKG